MFRLLILLLMPLPVAAETTASGSSMRADLGEQLVQVLGGLGIVLAMVMLLAWLAKRFSHSRLSGAHGMRLLGGLSLGAKERIVLVQVGDKQLLLGVAPGQLQTLHVLEQPIQLPEKPAAVSDNHSFANKLAKLLNQQQRNGK
ncbi:flagellar biosynthetic protein FliO [Thiolapillus sp.]